MRGREGAVGEGKGGGWVCKTKDFLNKKENYVSNGKKCNIQGIAHRVCL